MQKFKKYISEDLNFDAFTKKSVKRGIRSASSKDLSKRRFGIEIELDPEQFYDISNFDVESMDFILDAQSEWDAEHIDDYEPKSPKDFVYDLKQKYEGRISAKKSYGASFGTPNQILKVIFWSIVKKYVDDNWHDFIYHNKTTHFSDDKDYQKYFTQLFLFSAKKIKTISAKKPQKKKLHIDKNRIRSQLEKYISHTDIDYIIKQNLPTSIQHNIYSTYLYNVDEKEKSHFSHYKDIDNHPQKIEVFPKTLKEFLRLFKIYDDADVETELNELEMLIQDNIEWHKEGGKEEAFEKWFRDEYIPEHIRKVVDYAKNTLSKKLKLDWDYEWDLSGAVELKTKPISSKDFKNLEHDLSVLQYYETGSDKSAHIHIEKGNDFGDFETVASLLLLDEDTMSDNDRAGWGRDEHIYHYAHPIAHDIFHRIPVNLLFTAKEIARRINYQGNMSGSVYHNKTTLGKTVEYRFGSATLLAEYPKILKNIQYYMALISNSKRRNVVVKTINHDIKSGFNIYSKLYLVRTYGSNGFVQVVLDTKNRDEYFKLYPEDREKFILHPEIKKYLSKHGNLRRNEVE